MSWWVKEHIAVNDDETKQMCSIEADTQTSLPAADQTATAGFIIVRGSSALVLDTGDKYIMNSSGTWRQQPSGVQLDLSGYATTQDLTDGLAAKVDTSTYTAGQAAQDAALEAAKIRMQDSGNIRLNQLTWTQTGGGTGMWIADAFVVTSFETVVSAIITSFGAIKPSEITSLWLYLPSSVEGMKTIRLVCDRDPTGLTSNPTIRIRAFGYGT